MTIEERAKKYCESYKDSYKGQAFQDFMAGAAEQRKIDIDKACEWIADAFAGKKGYDYSAEGVDRQFIADFRKEMEEQL